MAPHFLHTTSDENDKVFDKRWMMFMYLIKHLGETEGNIHHCADPVKALLGSVCYTLAKITVKVAIKGHVLWVESYYRENKGRERKSLGASVAEEGTEEQDEEYRFPSLLHEEVPLSHV